MLAIVLAQDFVYPGYLFISSIEDEHVHQRIGVEEDNVLVTKKQNFFSYESKGAMSVIDTGKYLTIDITGKLVLDFDRNRNFLVSSSTDKLPIRNFTYGGISTFELCGDNLIGCMSKCDGARKITITYEDYFGPR